MPTPLTAAQLINATSGEVEYFTPSAIIEAARRCMGSIDLDPFSSALANGRVRAARFFTAADDGFVRPWSGNVWCNHPFGRTANARAVEKMEREIQDGRVQAICALTFACTSERWFQPLLRRPQCYLSPRTNYHLPDGSLKQGVTKGSVVTYFGRNPERFAESFRPLGAVKGPAL